eukprot:gene2018-2707_t
MNTDIEDMPLSALFSAGKETFEKLDQGSATQEELRSGAECLRRCKDAINRLGLFSRNEDKDDIATGDIKYMLVPFYLATILSNIKASERKIVLMGATSEFKSFLSACEDSDILTGAAREAFHRDGPIDANTRRMQKISAFKRNKEINARLEALRIAEGKDAIGEGEDVGAVEYSEEDREMFFLQIESAIIKSLEDMDMIKTELQVLAARPERTDGDEDEPTGPTPEQQMELRSLVLPRNVVFSSGRPSPDIGVGGCRSLKPLHTEILKTCKPWEISISWMSC